MSKPIPNIRPWLYVTAAFLLLIAAWSSLIMIAMKHTPERIQITNGR
jgi:hypothetical protein